MKKKIANAIELICLIISFVILNIKSATVIGDSVWLEPYKVSPIDCMENTLGFIPMSVLYLLCSIMCLVSIISKNKEKDGIIHGVLAIMLFVSVNWNLITSTSGGDIISNNFPGELFEIVLFLAVVVAFAKRSSLITGTKKEETVQKTVINNVNKNTTADEIKKYKDLLDNGAITQEEYDEKKKQLLNL